MNWFFQGLVVWLIFLAVLVCLLFVATTVAGWIYWRNR